MAATFKTNPVKLSELLADCGSGKIQLPDFQRSWVWDDDRIRSVVASVSQAFPVGALMTLQAGGDVNFHPRPVQGAPEQAAHQKPVSLLLDGQQRMTSLFQALVRNDVIHTRNAKGQSVDRYYYIDMRRALDPAIPRDEAIVGVDVDKQVKGAFGAVLTDLSDEKLEFEQLMFPLNRVFDKAGWQQAFWLDGHAQGRFAEQVALWQRFDAEVLSNFEGYLVPVIELGSTTSREAICLVFEKVNTGGKALDAFELVTAMFAASGFRLRDDWAARERKLHTHAVLRGVSSIDFLQAISLIDTARLRAERLAAGVAEPPPVTANRAALLRLPLEAYQREADRVEKGFERAAKFLRRQYIFRVLDLPYQSQLVPLAAMLAVDAGFLEHAGRFERLSRWYWCGVFGELYGGATDTRIAKDFTEVPGWASGQGVEPTTVTDAIFRSDRLDSMSSRLSAAYKGVSARLMEKGARDFRSGQPFDHAVFFDESVDIHHVFPRAWCVRNDIRPRVFNSIINKTPLSAKTNRILGGLAPSTYLERLAKGTMANPPIAHATLDAHLISHCIEPSLLRSDSFEAFMEARRNALLELITAAMGKLVYRGARADDAVAVDDGIDAEDEDLIGEEPELAVAN